MEQTPNSAQLMSQVQRHQDTLADRFGTGLVLTDAQMRELTIPSRMPIKCFQCRRTGECMKEIRTRMQADTLFNRAAPALCPEHHLTFAFKTGLSRGGEVFLIGKTAGSREELSCNLKLIEAIFALPVSLEAAPEPEPERDVPAPRRGGDASPLSGLSPQELNVFMLIGRGLPNKEIAAELHISANTVKSHVSRLLRKLNLSNRTDIAIAALNHGLVKGKEDHVP